jgi:hypothetical protein
MPLCSVKFTGIDKESKAHFRPRQIQGFLRTVDNQVDSPLSENYGVNTSSLVVNVLNFSKGYKMTISIDSIKAVTEILNFKQRKAHGSSFGW